jgi:hypothetical protein
MIKDNEHPFFRPLWRRIAVMVVCAGWSALEFTTGSANWGMIALAFTAYGAWQYLYAYKAPPLEGEQPQDNTNGEG